ncbi:MAG: response regulator [Verrucomicrobiota bacterium]|jgi:PAS domain S-box-containing protein
MNILIVDDNEQNLYQLQVLLSGNGYHVTTATQGVAALDLARQNPPNLIIADILMPVMDGFALCRECKKDKRLKAIPFVFYTATYTDERDREFALSLGAAQFIVKPEEPDAFLAIIRRTIEQIESPPVSQTKPAADVPIRLPIEMPEEDEPVYLKQYNAALIRKLEAKMEQLERANRELAYDIAERKQMAEAHARLATAVEQAAEAIVITDTNGKILYVNPAFEKTAGYTWREAVGQNPRILKSGKYDSTFYRQMWDSLAQGKVWSGRIINKKKSGALYEEDMIISPIRDSAGRIINYVAVKRDVTQEVALAEQLRQVQKMESIGQLAGGVAHDFNNILTVIQGNASLLLDAKNLSEADVDLAKQIIHAAERAAGLTRQLLVFSRKQVMQPAHLNLNEVVGNMTKMLQRILGEDIALQSDYTPILPLVFADAGMIEQVLLNLAVNARDAMPDGGRLTIATTSKSIGREYTQQNPAAIPGRCVCLSVSDTGCGIAPEQLSHIFEPFFTTKEIGKGTGLGLATVYGIVKQHRGWIEIKSQVGKGTTFRIYLPAAKDITAKQKTTVVAEELPHGDEVILVVEDEQPVRLLVGNLLQRCGYTVLLAVSGIAALDVWEKHKDGIQLLLTDMVLPDGMMGRELAEKLKGEKPQLKVIYTSGYSANVVGKGPSLVEGINFLQKPYHPHKLAQTVRDCLDRK